MARTHTDEKIHGQVVVEPDLQTLDDVTKTTNMGSYLRVFKYADKNDIFLNAIAVIGAVVAGAALPLVTLVFGRFVQGFGHFSSKVSTKEEFEGFINNFVLWFIYLFAAKFASMYLATVCVTITSIRITRRLRENFLESTLRQEISFFDKQEDSSVATRITTSTNRISQGIAEKLVLLISALALFFASFIVAMVAQWKLALIAFSVIPAIFLVSGICVPREAEMEGKIVKIYSEAARFAQDAISSVRAVHAFSAQNKMSKIYNSYLERAHFEGDKKSLNFGILFSIQFFCIYSAVALAFWEGFRMIQRREINDVGVVFTVALSVVMAAGSLSSLMPQMQAVTDAGSAARELFETIDRPSRLDPLAKSGICPPWCHGNFELKDLSFVYPSRPQAKVLRDLTISIPAKKTTALIGPSGCGKSTVVGLLERWYEPTSGKIFFDGEDLVKYNIKWIRSQVRLIQQEPLLFKGTIFENVAYGLVDSQSGISQAAKVDLVVRACKEANAHDFIQNLPDGYSFLVGERGKFLSGGQRQRIAIARCIISNPKVLILDEATSALDSRSEYEVRLGLQRACKDRTVLVIAHKLETIKQADNIVVLSSGRVIEQGDHDYLIEKDGAYAAWTRSQMVGKPQAVSEGINHRLHSSDDPEMRSQRASHDSETTSELSRYSEGHDPGPQTSKPYSLLRCLIEICAEQKGLGVSLFIAAIGCVVEGGTYCAQALLYSQLLTTSASSQAGGFSQANFYALMFFIVALANMVAYFAMGWACNIIGQAVTHQYRLEIFDQFLKQDIEFFDRPENTVGALTSRLTMIPTQLQELISINILIIFAAVVNVLSTSVLAIAFGWKLGCVAVFGGLVPLLLCGYLRIRLETSIEGQNRERFSESTSLAVAATAAIRTIASLTLEQRMLEEYQKLLRGMAKRAISSTLWTMLWFSLSQSAEFLIMALAFWYGAELIAEGQYTPLQFYVIFLAVIFGGQAAARIFGHSTSVKNAASASRYILELRGAKPPSRSSENDHEPKQELTIGPISIQDLSFRYPRKGSTMQLRHVSVTINSGSFYALVGPSGCGKSTLISLLERFYDPVSGCILVNGKDLMNLDTNSYRRHVSLVEQMPTLFEGTIRDNITLGLSSDVSDEEICKACEQANVWDFVSSLPDGVMTACGPQGQQLSGGQRQRLAIARALIRKPRLLLLDEATSALDSQNENRIQESLDQASRDFGMTTIAVAQRLSTIRKADMIIVLVNGAIREIGSHDALINSKGFYYDMCNAQTLMGEHNGGK